MTHLLSKKYGYEYPPSTFTQFHCFTVVFADTIYTLFTILQANFYPDACACLQIPYTPGKNSWFAFPIEFSEG